MRCGYHLEEARREARDILCRAEFAEVEAIFAVDATSYFSRPGPRLVDGVELRPRPCTRVRSRLGWLEASAESAEHIGHIAA